MCPLYVPIFLLLYELVADFHDSGKMKKSHI